MGGTGTTLSDIINLANERPLPSRRSTIKDAAELENETGFSSTPAGNKRPPAKPTITSSFSSHDTLLYGFDLGEPDTEISGEQSDTLILDFTPPERVSALDYQHFLDNSFHRGLNDDAYSLQRGCYYGRRGRNIYIPKSLLPLPDMLLSCPANLLYFHHFINNTARLLVAHDCSHNSFRSVIPRCEYLMVAVAATYGPTFRDSILARLTFS